MSGEPPTPDRHPPRNAQPTQQRRFGGASLCGMTEPETLHVTVRGGEHDGETFDLSADDAGAGDTVPYLDGHYRLIHLRDQGWIARVVHGDV